MTNRRERKLAQSRAWKVANREVNRERDRERAQRYGARAQASPSAKLCPQCGETKTAKAFSRSSTKANGLQSWCKECQSRRTAERRRVDAEYRERERQRNITRRRSEPWVEDASDRERHIVGSPAWARMKLRQAVARGDVAKPHVCERCGTRPPRHRLHGHHWHGDYANRPLDVEWLCSLCHGDEHRIAA